MKSQPLSGQVLLICWLVTAVASLIFIAGAKALPGMWHSHGLYLLGESISMATAWAGMIIFGIVYAQRKSRKNIDSNAKLLSGVFWALSDPIRLEIVERLSRGELVTVDGLASVLGISSYGVRSHVQQLVKANVVSVEPNGRNGRIRLVADALIPVREFATAAD